MMIKLPKNMRMVVNHLPEKFKGHKFLFELAAEERAKGMWYVRCVPFKRIKEISFWEKITGKIPDVEVIDCLLDQGQRVEIPGGGEDIRDGVAYFPLDPQDFPEWFMGSSMGQVKEIVNAMTIQSMSLARIQRTKRLSEQQLQDEISSGGMSKVLFKRWTDVMWSLTKIQMEQKEGGRPPQQP